MAESNLKDMVADIIADGVVDADEVNALRANLLADGVIDREECDALFEINDAVSGNANDASWSQLFVESITAHIMDDATIDDEEIAYLVDKIQGDGQVDATELALLENLKAVAGANFPAALADLM